MAIKSRVKSILNGLFQEYRINWIYASSSKRDTKGGDTSDLVKPLSDQHRNLLANSPTAKMRSSVGFNKSGLDGYVIEDSGRPVCVAHFADPARYDRAKTWPLKSDDMALMDIATEEAMRGKGIAVRLIAATSAMFLSKGKQCVIAFIWWSNTPSVHAFKKAGWRRIGLSVEIFIGGKSLGLRVPFWP
jgi:GNAT superfamily N-acetyltransferase